MTRISPLRLASASALFLLVPFTVSARAPQTQSITDPLAILVERAGNHVAKFLDVISDVNCRERVLQEKLNEKGKTEEKAESTFDYLIMLSTGGGEFNLVESRIAPEDAKQPKKQPKPLLISNGFSTLFLVFHPYYAPGFHFVLAGEDALDGKTFTKVDFRHIVGMRSPAALAVRGREYPLELSGSAWIDAQSGAIAKITGNVESGMEDVGLLALRSEVRFSPVTFHGSQEAFWLPAQAVVEVQSRHQHWRNTHEFSDYRRFSVETQEQIAKQ
ncbi:MAG: hypothetical protein ACHQLQ_06925 [Candidatus Acidiferrales bacterium]